MKIIVATNMNNVIGSEGKIPWTVKEDLKHFYQKTVNNIVIMGRKTYESLGSKPLSKRYNIILTSQKDPKNKKNLFFANNLEQAVFAAEEHWRMNPHKTIYVIGGSGVYDLFLRKNYISEIILTQVWDKSEGDTFFEVPEGWKIHDNWDISEKATIYVYKNRKPSKKLFSKRNRIN